MNDTNFGILEYADLNGDHERYAEPDQPQHNLQVGINANNNNYPRPGKRTRDGQMSTEKPGHHSAVHQIRYIRVLDVGSKLKPGEQRNKKIIEAAQPLPEGKLLKPRTIYWFVTTEEIKLSFDESFFTWKDSTVFKCNDQIYYLKQIDFRKKGTVVFFFNDGAMECIECCPETSNKRRKLNPALTNEVCTVGFEPQELINPSSTPVDNCMNNTSQILPDNNTIQSNDIGWTSVAPVHYNNMTDSSVHNFLLLVPEDNNLITMADGALQEIGFVKEVTSPTQQHLYSKRDSETKIQHVLLAPYANMARYSKIEEYLHFASEAILLIENLDEEQKDNFMAISSVKNIDLTIDNTRNFVVKPSIAYFGLVELDYSKLKDSAQLLISMIQQHQTFVGGASLKQEKTNLPLSKFFLRWTLGQINALAVQSIFVCFRYEPKIVKAFTEYAAATLASLNIDCEAVVCHGSVLVYVRCAAYIPWYIILHKEEIFNKLAEEGLTEIYECFISDVEESMQRSDNEEFKDELVYLMEKMISDGIAQKTNRFKVNSAEAENPIKFVELAQDAANNGTDDSSDDSEDSSVSEDSSEDFDSFEEGSLKKRKRLQSKEVVSEMVISDSKPPSEVSDIDNMKFKQYLAKNELVLRRKNDMKMFGSPLPFEYGPQIHQMNSSIGYAHNFKTPTNFPKRLMKTKDQAANLGFPPKKGPKIDQTNLLAEVEQKLQEKKVLVIHGVSGVGKSTLASEYGLKERLYIHQYSNAVWVDCQNEKTLLASFRRIAKFLNIKEPDGDQELQTVLETLQSSNSLVVYDNCNEETVEVMFSFFPNNPNPCHVIITTQLPQSKWPVERMEVAHLTLDNYSEVHILQYIMNVLGIQDPTQETMKAAKDIIKEYKSFTLLMQLIPQYIRNQDLTLQDFMRKYQDLFVTLAPLNIDRIDFPLKMIIDSLDLKNKMFLQLLSFMNSSASIQFFTESAFFVENQLSNTKLSDLKRAVSKLTNLSLIEFFDDGQAVRIGHKWIAQYCSRSTTEDDIQLIFAHWNQLFNRLIHMEQAKYEISNLFTIILKYQHSMDQNTQQKFVDTVQDFLINWTSLKLPQFYANIIKDFPSASLPHSILNGIIHESEEPLRSALEHLESFQIPNNLHMMIASLFYARMLSRKGQFNESLQLLDKCQNYMLQYVDEKHLFCQNVHQEYAIALYHLGCFAQADEIFTKHCSPSRMSDDLSCYFGLNKFCLEDYNSAWTILRDYIVSTVRQQNGCDLSFTLREGLARLLLCEIILKKPFPSIIYQDMNLPLHEAIYHATTLYETHRQLFETREIKVNQQTIFIGQFHNEPEQQYTAIGCQGRVIIIYKLAQDMWCIMYTNDFIWPGSAATTTIPQ